VGVWGYARLISISKLFFTNISELWLLFLSEFFFPVACYPLSQTPSVSPPVLKNIKADFSSSLRHMAKEHVPYKISRDLQSHISVADESTCASSRARNHLYSCGIFGSLYIFGVLVSTRIFIDEVLFIAALIVSASAAPTAVNYVLHEKR
jgi:hypothetical protein